MPTALGRPAVLGSGVAGGVGTCMHAFMLTRDVTNSAFQSSTPCHTHLKPDSEFPLNEA